MIDKFECDESIRQWLLKDENMHTMSLRTLSSLQDGEKVSFLVHKKHLSGIFHDNNQPESPANTFPIEQKQYDNLLGFIQYKREQSATQEPGSVNVYLTVRK
ncbi:MAG: hypothetical protein H6766_01160 [Candidatus Peribacteria bacterium]|nr:MAG: hypothetical protein H6766_01160 [Candidatus Peribacteria bacterium]